MNAKIEFAADLPEDLIEALGMSEETAFRAWFEDGALHVRVEEEPLDYGEVFCEGFDEGYAAGYRKGLTEGYERGYRDRIERRPRRLTGVPASREEGRRS